jgi:hypothetical protein
MSDTAWGYAVYLCLTLFLFFGSILEDRRKR